MDVSTRDFYERAGEKYARWQERRYLQFESLFDEMSWLQFSQYLPPDRNARILDAGCGGGGWSLRLARLGYRGVVLLDLAAACLSGARDALARQKVLDDQLFVQADLAANCLQPSRFDFIFCEREPLNYCVGAVDAAFAGLARALRPGGRLTVSMGTTHAIKMSLLRAGRYDDFFTLERHGWLMTDEGPQVAITAGEIRSMFERHGLQVLEISGRLAVADDIPQAAWPDIYRDPDLKARLLAAEMRYQHREDLANASSHIFAAGQK